MGKEPTIPTVGSLNNEFIKLTNLILSGVSIIVSYRNFSREVRETGVWT